VQTLTAMMSAPGWEEAWLPTSDIVELLLATPPADLEGYCEHSIRFARVYYGSKYPLNEAAIRAIVTEAFERSYYPAGRLRQLAATLTLGSWTEELKSVQVPTLVINGDADPLVPVAGGQALAAAIPGSTLMIVEGMGHSVPEAEAPRILGAILQHVK
jgi:pimeloyl-ACP methyl ester carboxylesterase